MATGKMYRHYGETWTCGFWDTWADRQTDQQRDRHTCWS